MAKFKQKSSQKTLDESNKIAKATQRPGQTKEQTKLIAQGIQKGIEQYKKKHKSKARDLDKKLKAIKLTDSKSSENSLHDDLGNLQNKHRSGSSVFPWVLLILSWALFGFYLLWF